ncbi:MAG: hypothetical protein LC135_09865 [Phycisphaerae bacterium]|nr:hypothetical protein [Phycisphaerae bacterium]MCZ2400154.1 hypothetical protein [Phycisphaerae bacterium]NUQ46711.1 hypothetical protein [Phycisphaerae bacterium]
MIRIGTQHRPWSPPRKRGLWWKTSLRSSVSAQVSYSPVQQSPPNQLSAKRAMLISSDWMVSEPSNW